MQNTETPNTKHLQAVALRETGEVIHVDHKMVELLELMWSMGITTNWSCQGDDMFKDPTHYEAMRYRAYIQMKHDAWSLGFIQELINRFYAFRSEKVLWTIEFNRNPKHGDTRICIRFPQADIGALVAELRTWN